MVARFVVGLAALAAAAWAAPCLGASPVARTPLESAVATWIAPVGQRLVVRNGDGGLDVWLIGGSPFDTAIEAIRRAVSARQPYDGGVRALGWTYLEPDRTYLVDARVAEEPVRLRLSRHMSGCLVELQQTGTAAEAPRWTPPFRPQPIALLHSEAMR